MLFCKHFQSFSYLFLSLPNLTGLLEGGNLISSYLCVAFSAYLALGPDSQS